MASAASVACFAAMARSSAMISARRLAATRRSGSARIVHGGSAEAVQLGLGVVQPAAQLFQRGLIAAADTHHPVQLGSVRRSLPQEIHTGADARNVTTGSVAARRELRKQAAGRSSPWTPPFSSMVDHCVNSLSPRMVHVQNRIRPAINRLDRSCHVGERIAGCGCAQERTSSAGAPAAWSLDLLLSATVQLLVGACGPYDPTARSIGEIAIG